MSTAAGYREFRRVAIMGSGLLFAAGLLLGLVYARDFGGYWIVMLWTAVAAPVVATIGLTSALMLGWYSPGFGEKLPATSLVGEGSVDADQVLRTVLAIDGS